MSAVVALVGDYRESVVAHRAIPRALELACRSTGADVTWTWLHTTAIGDARQTLAGFAAVWAVPATPYASMDGALAAIRFARETGRPFLGTCGGFQHALIEIARNVCGFHAADHAETAPAARPILCSGRNTESDQPLDPPALVITPLTCALVEKSGEITFAPGTRLHSIFGGKPTTEGYHCSYGLNPAWRERLEAAGLHCTGFDAAGEVRAAELPAHPFFMGTLFQPERSALRGEPHPLIAEFVRVIAQTGPRP